MPMFLSDFNIIIGEAGSGKTVFAVELIKILKNEVNIVFDCDGSFFHYVKRHMEELKNIKIDKTRIIQTTSQSDIKNKLDILLENNIKCNVFIDSVQCLPGQIVDKQYNNFFHSLPKGQRYIITKNGFRSMGNQYQANYVNIGMPYTKFLTTSENNDLFVNFDERKMRIRDFASQYMRNLNLNILLDEK